MSGDASSVSDPRALIRSAQYRSLLVLAAVVGLVVSTAAWLFLESVHEIEVWVYQDLPHHAGYHTAPEWWPLPWLLLAGMLTAFAVMRLPGHGGHVPAEGIEFGGEPVGPVDLPGPNPPHPRRRGRRLSDQFAYPPVAFLDPANKLLGEASDLVGERCQVSIAAGSAVVTSSLS